MRIARLAVVMTFGVLLAAPVRAGEPDRCGAGAPCDYASGGAACPDPEPTDTIFPLEVESMRKVEALASACRGPWTACRKDLDAPLADLGAVDGEIADLERRANRLPDDAVVACAGTRPALARTALGDVTSWCAVNKDACLGAVRDAIRMLGGLPAWSECVERMEARQAANAAYEARCVAAAPVVAPVVAPLVASKAPVAPAADPTLPAAPPAAPAPPAAAVQAPATAPTAATAPQAAATVMTPSASGGPASPLTRTPRAQPLTEVFASPTVVSPAPTAVYDPPAAEDPSPAAEPTSGPVESAVATASPRPPASDRRKGEIALSVAPFSGVMTIRDPATKAEYQPLSASVALGLDVVVGLSRGLDLELGVAGRGTFASSALQQATSVALDQLDTSSGTAILIEVEPTLTLLSQYVGVGFVSDLRWDSIGVTSATTGLVSSKGDGVAAGVRLVAGFGLLDHDLRFLGTLDYLFAGAADGQWRAGLRADLGACLITASYEQYFQVTQATEGHVVDHLQLTLGFRMPF